MELSLSSPHSASLPLFYSHKSILLPTILNSNPKSIDFPSKTLFRRHNYKAQSSSSHTLLDDDDGFFLEDVPHLTDFLPDLPKTFTVYGFPFTGVPNPLKNSQAYAVVKYETFVRPEVAVAQNIVPEVHFRRAGPREKVGLFQARGSACLCSHLWGLCPGINTVIQEIVCGLNYMYGVDDILGIEFYSRNTLNLTPKVVNDIHKRGGTFIRTSRGGHDTHKIVDNIQDRGINQVYIIGGDGTQKGAARIHEEVERRCLQVAVAGIPKTIDNDIAVSFAIVLISILSGGFRWAFEYIEERIKENGHMVIVIAEGAGQEYVSQSMGAVDERDRDASGNRLLLDVGLWLSEKIKDHFTNIHKTINMKYIDPTYMIRAIPSNASDNIYCTLLAHSAVHGAMAGYTGFTVGQVNSRHAYIPIARVTETNTVKLTDRTWARVLASTNQPTFTEVIGSFQGISSG
ncbi:hypothetical protein K2173_027561 [Erythroxylum novogranatense]|uniref:Phosphofructokinase domain-containing protein n=1 Tax=Erythroxylum novogranatense TaxID=1862640 RepID=A0AAV8U278_9ROSI|nr:hypothetical protein K2173_027561 [Erythroxylum novogranatense]